MTRSPRRIVMVGALLGVIFGSAAALAQNGAVSCACTPSTPRA